jgi:BlaI family transcriptional regulator, penicillinase repressor
MVGRKGDAAKELPPLSRLEQRIMGIVWNLGECSSAAVISEHNKTEHLAETTIRTVIANLRKKGYIELVPTIERQHRLKPAVSREKVGKRTLRDLVSGFFGGSPQQVFNCFLMDESLSEEELESLRRMIEEKQAERK